MCMLSHDPLFCGHSPLGSCVHGIFKQEYWSGLRFLLQWIFLTQEFNLHLLGLLHYRQILYPLSHQRSLFAYAN